MGQRAHLIRHPPAARKRFLLCSALPAYPKGRFMMVARGNYCV